MAQIPISNYVNYKLDTKGANKLAFELHVNLSKPGFVDNVIDNFGLDTLIKTKNSGLITNILYYFVETNNTDGINQVISIVDDIANFKLMKRDYMMLIKYFYHTNYSRAQAYFTNYILGVKSNFNTSILEKQDIDFILENNFYKLLSHMSGLFASTNINSDKLVSANSQLKKYSITHGLKMHLIDQLKSHMGNYVEGANNFYKKQMRNIKVIIDAGNVLHTRNGKVNIKDLFDIIEQTRKTIGDPVVVIHKRHWKLNPELTELFAQSNVKYFQTPYNFNDDTFIMWFFVKSSGTLNIVSNDKYRDHIYKYQSSRKSDDFFMSEFSNVLTEQTLSYQLEPMHIQSPLAYSNCIQVIGTDVFVPHTSGKFVHVKL